MRGIIEDNWQEFLNNYYLQPCGGCKDGHPSFWKIVIESKEWKDWKEFNENDNWDYAECEELGILSKGHWDKFIEFIKSK